MIKEMRPEIKEKWDEFLKWIEKEHHVTTKIWMPDYYSIELWLEFKEYKDKERR